MNQTLVLLKIGGGLITVKQTPHTAKPAIIRSLASEISRAKKHYKFDLIAGTGAGSFGHFTAHHYGLRTGAQTPQQFFGVSKTHAEVAHLNKMFVHAMLRRSLPALSIAPSAIMTCRDGQLIKAELGAVQTAVHFGMIPVLHGDCLFDTSRGITILSTERLLEACLIKFRPIYEKIIVVYLTNKKGVLDSSGQVISDLTRDTELSITTTATHDVTGGMAEKITAARNAVDHGADAVYIACGLEKGVLAKLLSGQPTGTKVS